MGSTVAEGMAGCVNEGLISLKEAVRYHLTANHYPPHPAEMVDVAIEAIENPDQEVEMPEGIEHHTYGKLVPAWVIIESLHLDCFIIQEEY